ncbi:MAG: hypothetical protein DMG13_03505 [Acidobacteria bacterium]|nr:MAG: hypothetical protein DMG13_03505 [Acidobacteriota bacterium]
MKLVTLLSVVSLLASCQFSENRYLTRLVKPEELIGSWRATEFAIKSLRDVGVREHLSVQDHTVVLKADGSCSIQTIVNMPDEGRVDYRTYLTGCRWRLGNIGHQTLELDLTPAPAKGSAYYYFAEEDGRLLLWQYATDPDAWRYMEYERKGA